MKSAAKWISITGLGLISLMLATLLVIPLLVDLNRYKPFLEEKLTAATGRPVRIGSDLKLSLFPRAGVDCSDLTLDNPEGFGERPLLKIDAFSIRARLMPLLLRRDMQVEAFVIRGPQVTLIKRRDGRKNWHFSTPKPSTAGSAAPTAPHPSEPAGDLAIGQLAVGTLTIENGSVLYIDQTDGTNREMTDFNLTVENVSFDRPLPFKASARLERQPIRMEGTLGPISGEIGQRTIPLSLDLKAFDELRVKITGQVKHPAHAPTVELALAASPFSPKKLVGRLMPGRPIETADPAVLQTMHLKAKLKADQKSVSLSEGRLQLDDTTVEFSLNAPQVEPLSLAFHFDLDRIDLDRYLPPKTDVRENPPQRATLPQDDTAGQTGPSSEAPAPDKAIYRTLRPLALDGKINAGTVVINRATINDVQLTVNGRGGVFHIDPFRLKTYRGTIAGSGVFDVTRTVPAIGVDMRIHNLQVGPLLRDQMQKDILEGTTNATIQLKMVGDQPGRIKRTLDGRGEVLFNNGALVGIDLTNMVRNVRTAFGMAQPTEERPRTDFTELRVPYTVNKGVIATQETRLQSPFLRLQATGSADLVKETLDLRIEPKFVGTIKGQSDTTIRQGVVVPILVTGTFAKPMFRPDLKSMAKEQLESKTVQKIFEKKKLKPYEKTAKELLKGLLNN